MTCIVVASEVAGLQHAAIAKASISAITSRQTQSALFSCRFAVFSFFTPQKQNCDSLGHFNAFRSFARTRMERRRPLMRLVLLMALLLVSLCGRYGSAANDIHQSGAIVAVILPMSESSTLLVMNMSSVRLILRGAGVNCSRPFGVRGTIDVTYEVLNSTRSSARAVQRRRREVSPPRDALVDDVHCCHASLLSIYLQRTNFGKDSRRFFCLLLKSQLDIRNSSGTAASWKGATTWLRGVPNAASVLLPLRSLMLHLSQVCAAAVALPIDFYNSKTPTSNDCGTMSCNVTAASRIWRVLAAVLCDASLTLHTVNASIHHRPSFLNTSPPRAVVAFVTRCITSSHHHCIMQQHLMQRSFILCAPLGDLVGDAATTSTPRRIPARALRVPPGPPVNSKPTLPPVITFAPPPPPPRKPTAPPVVTFAPPPPPHKRTATPSKSRGTSLSMSASSYRFTNSVTALDSLSASPSSSVLPCVMLLLHRDLSIVSALTALTSLPNISDPAVLLQPQPYGDLITTTGNRNISSTQAQQVNRWALITKTDVITAPTILANLTLHVAAAPEMTKGLLVKNVTLGGGEDVALVAPPASGDSWHALAVRPLPGRRWVGATPLMEDTTVTLVVQMTCGGEDSLRVQIVVPAPGVRPSYASEVQAAASSSQLVALLSGGAASGAALGRVMATRSMVMCDADSAMGGGVLDLGLAPCDGTAAGAGSNAARSAVLSNVVLLAVAALALVIVALVFAALLRTACGAGAAVVLLPSSLLPAFVLVLPSTAAAGALLAGRLGTSTCVGADSVVVVLSAVTVVLPVAALVRLCWASHSKGWLCEHHRGARMHAGRGVVWAALRGSVERRYKWRSNASTAAPLEVAPAAAAFGMANAWAVLLEYRVIWYAALDCALLALVGLLAVVGGLSQSHCELFTALVVALLALQLVVLQVVRPYTTVFSHVCSSATLALTLLSVTGQLVFAHAAGAGRDDGGQGAAWALTISGVCNLAIVGVSLAKSLLDVAGLANGVVRRVRLVQAARRGAAEVGAALLIVSDDDLAAIVVPSSSSVAHRNTAVGRDDEAGIALAELNRLYWDEQGAVLGGDDTCGVSGWADGSMPSRLLDVRPRHSDGELLGLYDTLACQ